MNSTRYFFINQDCQLLPSKSQPVIFCQKKNAGTVSQFRQWCPNAPPASANGRINNLTNKKPPERVRVPARADFERSGI
jgi:hypothetical protein